MSADLLAEAEALLEAATPGPWRASEYGFVEAGADTICQFWDKYEEDFPHRQANAALIAAAPSLIPRLVTAVRERDARLGRVEALRDRGQAEADRLASLKAWPLRDLVRQWLEPLNHALAPQEADRDR